jgi:hypothetical protein
LQVGLIVKPTRNDIARSTRSTDRYIKHRMHSKPPILKEH